MEKEKTKVGIRINSELSHWLDNQLLETKRSYHTKIKKEAIFEVLVEFLKDLHLHSKAFRNYDGFRLALAEKIVFGQEVYVD